MKYNIYQILTEVIIIKHRPQWVDQAIKDGKYPFFVQMPAKATKDKNGRLTIQVLGSKVERSRSGHKMMQTAIDMMKKDSIGKISLINHDPDQVLGKVTDLAQSPKDEIHPIILVKKETGNPIIDAPIKQVESCIDEEIPLGASFGGIADNVKFVEEDDKIGVDVYTLETMEWSVTPLNAVKSSDGTLKPVNQSCQDGVCGQIAQQIINGPYLPEITRGGMILKQNDDVQQSTGPVLNQTAYNYALQCIAEENIDFETPWNLQWDTDYSDLGNLDDMMKSCLGIDETSSNNWDKYQYRICKDGKLYKNAVIAVAAKAPAGSQIYEAADELLKQIYEIENTLENPNLDESTELNQKLEVDSMDEETKKMIQAQNQKIDGILEHISKDIEAKKLAEQKEAEKAARDEIKQELKEEVVEEFTKEILPKLAESTNQAFEQKIAELTGTRTHVQQSAQGSNPEETPTKNPILQAAAPLNDPKSSIAHGQKCVVLGQTVEGHTPAEYLQGHANQ